VTFTNSQPFPVDQITIDRATRQRQESADFDVSDLKHSLSSVGLINPVIIQRDGLLRAGERRLTAVRELGWTHIDVRFVEELDETELHLLELDENLRRKNLSWQDECRAVHEYHRLRGLQSPDWSATQTADALGLSQNTISKYIAVAKELESGNEKVLNAERYSQAQTITEKVLARRRTEIVSRAIAESAGVGTDAPAPTPAPAAPLLNVDFIEWAREYRGDPFNFLHCDFPYGVNMTGSGQGANAVFGEYADDADIYWKLINALAENLNNLVAPSAHMMFWFSMDNYSETKVTLELMGWYVNPFPLIWYKSDNTGMMPDVRRQGRRVYETAFFCNRGDRFIIDAVSNLFPYPGREKEIHMSEKPAPMLAHFFRMFVDEYSVVLDPTAGSANALRVARSLGAKAVLGLELNPEFFALATEHFHDEL
jgi:ParB/RepB/Spo0J family partition protein